MIVSENSICESALKKFGFKKQMIKCVEELSELQKELCKMSLGQGKRENIAEEIADVEIMLEQMKIGLSIGFYEFNAVKSKKLHRLAGILAEPLENQKIVSEDEKELQNEAKCKMCLFSFMTEEALAELGSDPCETCRNLCNWKPKELTQSDKART